MGIDMIMGLREPIKKVLKFGLRKNLHQSSGAKIFVAAMTSAPQV